jgi:histidinol-phosphatase (PHP family)
MNNIIDCHSHSNNSPDGNQSVEAMCDKATQMGLFAFGISDHFEANGDVNFYEKTSRNSFLETENYKNNYRTKTKILTGIELGQPLQNLEFSEKIIGMYDYDFIIGSLHNLNLEEDFFYIDYTNADVSLIMKKYFDELLDMVIWGKFNVLGHLTYPIRYISGKHKINVDINLYKNQIDEILKTIIKKDIALEINTSNLRGVLKDTMPSLDIVKRYAGLGGKLITVGADAHNSVYIGSGIDVAYDMIKKAGINNACFFERKNIQFIKI